MENKVSNLSQVFPKDTTYFYGFPTGWDSGFYNACPPDVEELVAMRTAVCAGPDTNIITFASTVSDEIWGLMQDDLGVPLINRNRVLQFPGDVDTSMVGVRRNVRMRDVLKEILADGQFIMAQPYNEERLRKKYLIDPGITTWLNDKGNIRKFVPDEYCTPEYANVQNGKEFTAVDGSKFPYPCVVKVMASSAGDGVRVCNSPDEFKAAQEAFSKSDVAILVQKYINRVDEIDVKFVVHPDGNKQFELLGYSSEITGSNGEYFGGIIHNPKQPSEMARQIYHVLETQILPKLQERGWFGVGGVDVLVDQDGKFYFSDFNCRMTATMAQTMQANAGMMGDNSVAVFNGRFDGNIKQFGDRLQRHARNSDNNRVLNVVSLARGDDSLRLHGGVIFDQIQTLRENISLLESLGVHSDIFAEIAR